MARGSGCTTTHSALPRRAQAASPSPAPTLLPTNPAHAASLVAQARETHDLAAIAAARAQIAALAPGETLYVGGLSVYRHHPDYTGSATHGSIATALLKWGDEGYTAHIQQDDDPIAVLQTQRLTPLFRARHERNLRLAFQNGMPGARTEAATWTFIRAAVAANAANERYAQLRAAFPALDEIIIPVSSESSDRRVTALVRDVLEGATWQGSYAALNSEKIKVGLQLQAKGSSGFTNYSPTGSSAPKPGDSGSTDTGGLAATLRHEYAHGVWERLSDDEQDGFIALLPEDENEIHEGLTHYAALVNLREYEPNKEQRYGGGVRGGYRTETFAELVAVTSHPGYDASLYPAWVRDAERFLIALVESRLAIATTAS